MTEHPIIRFFKDTDSGPGADTNKIFDRMKRASDYVAAFIRITFMITATLFVIRNVQPSQIYVPFGGEKIAGIAKLITTVFLSVVTFAIAWPFYHFTTRSIYEYALPHGGRALFFVPRMIIGFLVGLALTSALAVTGWVCLKILVGSSNLPLAH